MAKRHHLLIYHLINQRFSKNGEPFESPLYTSNRSSTHITVGGTSRSNTARGCEICRDLDASLDQTDRLRGSKKSLATEQRHASRPGYHRAAIRKTKSPSVMGITEKEDRNCPPASQFQMLQSSGRTQFLISSSIVTAMATNT